MDMSFTPEQEAFRSEVREWIAQAMPPHIATKANNDGAFSNAEVMEWHKVLAAKGWVAPHWPKEFGGPGFDATQRFIFGQEMELAGTPQLSPFGLSMVGPLIMQFGNDAQKQRFLPKILSGEEVWCQGYSEPNAGSDLASLKTRAEKNAAGNYVLNGQKTWTTYAQYADWIFVLARTNPDVKQQAGISFFLVDMKTPGLTVKPFLTTGGTPAFCETWFENVEVPKENLIGQENMGWTYAKALLGHERTLVSGVGISARTLLRTKRLAKEIQKDGRPLLEDPGFRAKIARSEIKLEALRMTVLRSLASAQLGHAPGPESSILKLRGTDLQQETVDLLMEVLGHDSLTWFNPEGTVNPRGESAPSIFNYVRAATIYAGSNEIQKNIIAKMILGLPSA
ncbi:MAG: acyl-CoA dehydrogenase family protein [Polyangiaceae bacterium]|nr:acyl-CoA dehydrogenase family protein [Myxococcales bacterium]MCB9588881.1 acyl-CoA dehydrogenase family protein [Polyangiaceae bacterium]MCB9605440.1 acyl-CoA dehydrogenase family protein [Polyangiaceae bacterium]